MRLLAETSSSCLERSSTTITSVRPRMWRVGVEYDGRMMESQSGLFGRKPAAATQNVLQGRGNLAGAVLRWEEVGDRCSHWWVRWLAIDQEWRVCLRLLKLCASEFMGKQTCIVNLLTKAAMSAAMAAPWLVIELVTSSTSHTGTSTAPQAYLKPKIPS